MQPPTKQIADKAVRAPPHHGILRWEMKNETSSLTSQANCLERNREALELASNNERSVL